MKTYLLDTYNRYKRYSETLDVKTKLCNRPWVAITDGGEREVYKFRIDGTIRIARSGVISQGTWEYDPTDKTMDICAGDMSSMVHPQLIESYLLGLQVDGTDECSFFIDESTAPDSAPKTYRQLLEYFDELDQIELVQEQINGVIASYQAKREKALEDAEEQQKYLDKNPKAKAEHEEKLLHSVAEYLDNNGLLDEADAAARRLTIKIGIIGFFLTLLYNCIKPFFEVRNAWAWHRPTYFFEVLMFSFFTGCFIAFFAAFIIWNTPSKKIKKAIDLYIKSNILSKADIELLKKDRDYRHFLPEK